MIELRRLRDGETDGELLALLVLGGAAALGIAWLEFHRPTPQCLFHTLTGLPCLTCGGTRCLRNLLAGHVATALAWNPLVFLGAVSAALFATYAALVIVFRIPRIRLGPLHPRLAFALRLAAVAALASNWIYLIFRFSRGG
jgi:hypothetical protein